MTERSTHSLRRRALTRRMTVYLALVLGSLFMALPFYWMVASSLKSPDESSDFPPTWVPGLDRRGWEAENTLTADGRAQVAAVVATLVAEPGALEGTVDELVALSEALADLDPDLYPTAAEQALVHAEWTVEHGEPMIATRRALSERLATVVERIEIVGHQDTPLPEALTAQPEGLVQSPALARAESVAELLTSLGVDAGAMSMDVEGSTASMPEEQRRVDIVITPRSASAEPNTQTIEGDLFGEDLSGLGRISATVRQVVRPAYWRADLRWENYSDAWHLRTREPAVRDFKTGLAQTGDGERRVWVTHDNSGQTADVHFTRYFYNSVVIAVVVTAGSLITSVLAAFALSSMTFVGSTAYFFLIIGTLYIPGQILLIPNYIFFDWMGTAISPAMGRNTYFCLIIPWLASVFSIFLLRQAFLTLPKDLFDAARIDGSSRLRYLFTVAVPLSKPTLITAAIFNFLGTWNSLLWPLVMAPEPKYNTIMVGLSKFSTEANNRFDLLMSASAFSILPIVILFFLLQRFFIAGIARSGLK